MRTDLAYYTRDFESLQFIDSTLQSSLSGRRTSIKWKMFFPRAWTDEQSSLSVRRRLHLTLRGCGLRSNVGRTPGNLKEAKRISEEKLNHPKNYARAVLFGKKTSNCKKMDKLPNEELVLHKKEFWTWFQKIWISHGILTFRTFCLRTSNLWSPDTLSFQYCNFLKTLKISEFIYHRLICLHNFKTFLQELPDSLNFK